MDIFRDQINRMVYEQKKLLAAYTREYDACYGGESESQLICCRNHGRDVYYRACRDSNGRYARKSLSKDPDAINTLARKEYLRVVIDTLRNNLDVFDDMCKNLRDLDLESLAPRMLKAYRKLPEEAFFSKEVAGVDCLSGENEDRIRRHREWAAEPYEKSDYMPEHRRFMTSAGFRVRSKSEQHIVEQLVNYGIPFRYEQVIHINNKRYSADFTFRDRIGELFYWEHAGMMDVPKYVDAYHRKMDAFEKIDIVPWKNLLITYDIDGVINVPMVKSIIEHDVIPRL